MVDFFTSIQPAISTAAVTIISAVVIYLGKVIADFIVALSRKHNIEVSEAEVKKFTSDLTNIVSDAIIATNQTYVNDLKSKGEFTKEAQEEANKRALDHCLNLMSVEMLAYINAVYGDAESLLLTKIEAMIGASKNNQNVKAMDSNQPARIKENPFYMNTDTGGVIPV